MEALTKPHPRTRRAAARLCAITAVMLGMQLSAPASAHAQWARAGSDDEVDAYFDPATRAVDGTIVKVRVLLDYKEPRQWTDYLVYSSVVSTREYDCASARQRVAASDFHFQAMATDEPRFSTPGGSSWKAIADTGIDRELWQRVCAP